MFLVYLLMVLSLQQFFVYNTEWILVSNKMATSGENRKKVIDMLTRAGNKISRSTGENEYAG